MNGCTAAKKEFVLLEKVRNLDKWKGWMQRSTEFTLICSLQDKGQFLRMLKVIGQVRMQKNVSQSIAREH